jgi:hypothetical protein
LPGQYLPWVALDHLSYSPATHFSRSEIPYVLVDGTVIASSWDDLTDGELSAPIELDETGQRPSSPELAWTAVNTDGTPADADCEGWLNGSHSARVGCLLESAAWTACFEFQCSLSARLYCFEQ